MAWELWVKGRVTKVRVVCQKYGDDFNHWAIFLLLDDRKRSIKLDTKHTPGSYYTNHLFVTVCDFTLPRSALKYWDFKVDSRYGDGKASVPYRYFGREIFIKQRDYYRTDHGLGCRWWVYTVIRDFCEKELIELDPYERLWRHLQFVYSEYRPRRRQMVNRGSFPDHMDSDDDLSYSERSDIEHSDGEWSGDSASSEESSDIDDLD
ncbi:hypothetical protein TWF281_009675 [Arthrobotrys megalospora]